MLANTYIVTGAEMPAPQVHVLAPAPAARLADGLGLAAKRQSDAMRQRAYLQAFGAPATYAFSVSNPAMLEWLVSGEFTGPHHEQVAAAAALLALGQPLPTDEPDDGPSGPSGGTKARLQPEPPRRPPGGAKAEALPDALRFT